MTTNHVTQSKTPVSSLQSDEASEGAPSTVRAEENGVEGLQSPVNSPVDMDTLREQVRAGLTAARVYLTPPSLVTDTPASLAELASYARWGGWTSSTEGPLRSLGIGWYRCVGLPVTAVCRYVEWIAQRPGRAVPVFVLWKLCLHTGGGPWLLDHVIHPVLGLAAWVLL